MCIVVSNLYPPIDLRCQTPTDNLRKRRCCFLCSEKSNDRGSNKDIETSTSDSRNISNKRSKKEKMSPSSFAIRATMPLAFGDIATLRSSNTSSSSRSSSQLKKVRFAEFNNKSIPFSDTCVAMDCDDRWDPPSLVSAQQVVNRWWTRDECDKFSTISHQLLKDFQTTHENTARHFLCVYSQCEVIPTPWSFFDAIPRLNLTDHRGLERGLVPWIRKHHVRTVLNWQERLRERPKGSTRDTMATSLAEELAVQAQRSSHPSSVMAILLAREDAAEASTY